MTLDEAIKHCEEVARQNEEDAIVYSNCKKYKKNLYEIGLAENAEKKCCKCAEEHRQLAEWLKELKEYKEQSGDAISRNEVIDTLNNMHRYIADELTLCSTGKKFEGNEVFIVDDVYEEIAENLPSVSSQSKKCEDAISRDKVIVQLSHLLSDWDDDWNVGIRKCIETVKSVESATPQQKTERWIPLEYDGYADGNLVWDKWECSKCGWEHSGDEESLTAFCPNCGAKMESEDEEQ